MLPLSVICWDIVLCNVLEYEWNTDTCDSYLHVIMTLRPTALHSCHNILANVKVFPKADRRALWLASGNSCLYKHLQILL